MAVSGSTKSNKKTIKNSSPWRKGKYTPTNPHKYLGDIDNIIYRSSWEKRVFQFLDSNKYIMAWASEPFPIPYMKPCMTNGKMTTKKANYYPDIYVEFIDESGIEKRQLIEIKPEKQTKSSRTRNAVKRLNENYVYAVNSAKWAAAKAWCDAHNIEFVIATEKSIFR